MLKPLLMHLKKLSLFKSSSDLMKNGADDGHSQLFKQIGKLFEKP
jgi:hypothetical protein